LKNITNSNKNTAKPIFTLFFQNFLTHVTNIGINYSQHKYIHILVEVIRLFYSEEKNN